MKTFEDFLDEAVDHVAAFKALKPEHQAEVIKAHNADDDNTDSVMKKHGLPTFSKTLRAHLNKHPDVVAHDEAARRNAPASAASKAKAAQKARQSKLSDQAKGEAPLSATH